MRLTSQRFGHAVVIGGSMAGLLATRVLSDHFRQVTILERDPVRDYPEVRKGQPHTRHVHGLLAGGFQVMERYFPELREALLAGGAVIGNLGRRIHWHTEGGYRHPVDFGADGAASTRPFLEYVIRRQVLALPNVRLYDSAAVRRLQATAGRRRVTGVLVEWREGAPDGLEPEGVLAADLVVDCGGRGSRLPRWLQELGYQQPPVSTVGVDLIYATCLYPRDPGGPHGEHFVQIEPAPPLMRRAGAMMPVEGNRWVVTMGAWHGDCDARDEASFLAHAASLAAPDIHGLIHRAEPLSDVVTYHFRASLRRHYEKLASFPDGLLALGDAIASFNPIFGQGMTVAALEAQALDRLLAGRESLQGLAPAFFRRASKVVDTPWQIAVGADFRFPQTTGEKPPGTDLINRYLTRLHRATHHDDVVCRAFLRVANLLEPPSSLFHPRIVWRVLRKGSAAAGPTSVRAGRPMGARTA
jgi:2-polyprenyl-6-methoxyphenol hydroxylase-like FAD-dependent oxidoreductase